MYITPGLGQFFNYMFPRPSLRESDSVDFGGWGRDRKCVLNKGPSSLKVEPRSCLNPDAPLPSEDWDLNSGLSTCEAGVTLCEPYPQLSVLTFLRSLSQYKNVNPNGTPGVLRLKTAQDLHIFNFHK
jgi:hypothetical protein